MFPIPLGVLAAPLLPSNGCGIGNAERIVLTRVTSITTLRCFKAFGSVEEKTPHSIPFRLSRETPNHPETFPLEQLPNFQHDVLFASCFSMMSFLIGILQALGFIAAILLFIGTIKRVLVLCIGLVDCTKALLALLNRNLEEFENSAEGPSHVNGRVRD